jgi:hypothetical protein
MVTTVKKSTVLMVVLGLMMSFFLAFGAPITAHADIPKVTVGSDGNMTIDGEFAKNANGGSAWQKIIDKYRGFIVGISGIAAITMVVIFIMQFLKLGASAGNPQARSAALTGVLWSGVAAAGLGAVSLIVGLFYNAIV